jgi:hypothetical protein
MIDIYAPEPFYGSEAIWMALDPSYSGDYEYEIDWENVDFDPQPTVEYWQVEIINDFYDLAENDPNVAPLLDWYESLPDPGGMVAEAVATQAIEGFIESAGSGYYDDWAFTAMVHYIYFTEDWDWFFDEYGSLF